MFPKIAKFRRDRERLQCSVSGQAGPVPTEQRWRSRLWHSHYAVLQPTPDPVTGPLPATADRKLYAIVLAPWNLVMGVHVGRGSLHSVISGPQLLHRSTKQVSNQIHQPTCAALGKGFYYSVSELYDACNRDRMKPDNLSWTRTCFHNYLLHPLYTSLRWLVVSFLWPSIWKSQMRPEANKSSNFELKASRRSLGCYESPGGSKWTCKGFMAWGTLANLCQYWVCS